jgi:hypothetical protein
LSVADNFPEATVVQSFMEIVKTLGQMVRFLPLATKGRDPMSVIRELARLGYVDQKSVSLFVNLRDAYTAAVRAGYVRLSGEEARFVSRSGGRVEYTTTGSVAASRS